MKRKIAISSLIMFLCIALLPSTFLAAVTVNPVSSSLHQGSQLTISGTSDLSEVIIKVSRPDNSMLYFNVSPVKNGIYSDTITLGQNEPIGTYTILVGQGEDISTTSILVTEKKVDGGGLVPNPTPGGGGSVPITTPAPPTEQVQVTVDNKKVSGQVNSPNVKEVKVEGPTLSDDKPEASIQIPATSMNIVAKSSKPLIFQFGTVQVFIPNIVLKDLVVGSPESITITVKKDMSSNVKGAVSATFDFIITSFKNGSTSTASKFSKPIQVTVPVSSVVKDSRKVAAYYLNETTKKSEYVGGKLKNGNVEFKTNHFSKFVVLESDKTFADIEKHWAQDEIEVLASRMITTGKTDTKFNPQGQITRAEFAVLIARALNLPRNDYKGTFTDVTMSKGWAYAEIEAAHKAGIVNGVSKTKFSPDVLITREEIATMIIRAIQYQDEELLNNLDTSKVFADASSIASYAEESVKNATALGIVYGREGNQFDPKANATRAQSAVMLYRTLEKLNEF
ncbi:S-layer homology domain-containing protein [Sporosarcina sp. FA9]|uniref:S-layer homology domain-containing protein n=1 Tax=Sporosarcina sp. FA9 TaxID=3413030 RepID=UPI003F6567B1